MDIDDEWIQFLKIPNTNDNLKKINTIENINTKKDDIINEPICNELIISTKTKVVFLNQTIDIKNIFWKIPIICYWKQISGVVKKQSKIISNSKDELNEYFEKLNGIDYFKEIIIKQIDNPNSRRIKFKDERKISIGISKKDITNDRTKEKYAFYNCFVLYLRFLYNDNFKEIHVKVFNTGKLEIPGVYNEELLKITKNMIINVLQPYLENELSFIDNEFIDDYMNDNNVLINSNFNCNFYINRENLFILLKNKYGLDTSYDPCSYPGVKCKYYYNTELPVGLQNGKINIEDVNLKMNKLNKSKKYKEVSFMIFRTGSCLIVGNCSENMIITIYNFIKNILINEYSTISINNNFNLNNKKNIKLKKKIINITNSYFEKIKL